MADDVDFLASKTLFCMILNIIIENTFDEVSAMKIAMDIKLSILICIAHYIEKKSG